MGTRVIPAAVVAAAVAILATGCAGGGGLGSSDGAASVVPANALAYVALDTTVSPGGLTSMRDALLRRAHLSWTDDVEPALGDELDLALLPGAKKPQGVALTQPRDPAKLD